MQLQKLVVAAHAVALAIEKRPLISSPVYSWQWGPVVPQIYKHFAKWGSFPISKALPDPAILSPADCDIVDQVWRALKVYPGSHLMTMLTTAPWQESWHTNPYGIIPETQLAEYFPVPA